MKLGTDFKAPNHGGKETKEGTVREDEEGDGDDDDDGGGGGESVQYVPNHKCFR